MDTFADIYRILRVAAVTVFFIFFIIFKMTQIHAHTFDVELPSGNSLQLEQEVDRQDRKDAYDRTQNGEGSDRDFEKAREYYDKDMV